MAEKTTIRCVDCGGLHLTAHHADKRIDALERERDALQARVEAAEKDAAELALLREVSKHAQAAVEIKGRLEDERDALREQIDLVARDMEILEKERDAALAIAKISREDLENWWDQCTQGLFTEHGDCPAAYACSSILSDLRDIDPTLDAALARSGERHE